MFVQDACALGKDRFGIGVQVLSRRWGQRANTDRKSHADTHIRKQFRHDLAQVGIKLGMGQFPHFVRRFSCGTDTLLLHG